MAWQGRDVGRDGVRREIGNGNGTGDAERMHRCLWSTTGSLWETESGAIGGGAWCAKGIAKRGPATYYLEFFLRLSSLAIHLQHKWDETIVNEVLEF